MRSQEIIHNALLLIFLFLIIVISTWLLCVIKVTFSIPFVIGTDDRSLSRMYIQEKGGNAFCITSGGCNPLDECMNRERVYTCDYNKCQNYILELKIAVVRELPYEIFWNMFGEGISLTFNEDYKNLLKRHLSKEAAQFWNKRNFYFDPRKGGLYHLGSVQVCFSRRICKGLWPKGYEAFFAEECVDVPTQIKLVNDPKFNKIIKSYGYVHRHVRGFSISGVIDKQWKDAHPDEVLKAGMLRRATISDSFCKDYVTRLYMTGSFTKNCCPPYLKRENYNKLKENVYRIEIIKGDMLTAMSHLDSKIAIFYPLDHLDCISIADVKREMIEMKRLSSHLQPGTPIAIIKSVNIRPSYLSVVQQYFHIRDVSNDLCYDGSDIYMIQSAFILETL